MRSQTVVKSVTRSFGGSALALAVAGLIGFAPEVGASSMPPAGWEVQSSEFADFWFGALAGIGYDGFGPVSLYDTEYAEQLRVRRERDGVYPAPLDLNADRLRRALLSNSAFEVLHFVPVYFAAATAGEALLALRAVAREVSGLPSGLPAATRFGVSVVGSVLATSAERAVLADLLDVLDEERARAAEPFMDTREKAREIQTLWNAELAPRLSEYLSARHLQGGRLIVTPALGREGRFFEGDPSNPSDNVVMIGVGPETSVADAMSALVRELCYPVVRDAFENISAEFADRSDAAAASDRAATRCGAMLLAELAPEALPAYQRFFRAALTTQGEENSIQPEFDDELDELMKRSIQRR